MYLVKIDIILTQNQIVKFMLHIAWDESYAHPLPTGHRFPMVKYQLIPEQLIIEGTISPDQLFHPSIMADVDILHTHTKGYLDKLNEGTLSASEIRRTGFPFSEQLVIREKKIMQGTADAALYALEYGVGMNTAGGTHHAFSFKGEGFCLFNDIAIAANLLLNKKLVAKILIVDLDVHQGNGTAEIFSKDNRVFTFSMHAKHNYPFHKEQSDLDVELHDGITDEAYLALLDYHIEYLMDTVVPDFVFFQSGVDIIAGDKLGKLNVSIEGCRRRDEKVLTSCYRHHVPVCISMGGGYSQQIRDIVEAHANTFRLAQYLYF